MRRRLCHLVWRQLPNGIRRLFKRSLVTRLFLGLSETHRLTASQSFSRYTSMILACGYVAGHLTHTFYIIVPSQLSLHSSLCFQHLEGLGVTNRSWCISFTGRLQPFLLGKYAKCLSSGSSSKLLHMRYRKIKRILQKNVWL